MLPLLRRSTMSLRPLHTRRRRMRSGSRPPLKTATTVTTPSSWNTEDTMTDRLPGVAVSSPDTDTPPPALAAADAAATWMQSVNVSIRVSLSVSIRARAGTAPSDAVTGIRTTPTITTAPDLSATDATTPPTPHAATTTGTVIATQAQPPQTATGLRAAMRPPDTARRRPDPGHGPVMAHIPLTPWTMRTTTTTWCSRRRKSNPDLSAGAWASRHRRPRA